MFLLPSEYSSPPRPPCALPSPSRSGLGLTTTLLRLGRPVGFCSLPAANQLPTQVVALAFGLFASPALLGHPLVQRGLRHLAAGALGAELLPDTSLCGAGLCPLRRLLDRL